MDFRMRRFTLLSGLLFSCFLNCTFASGQEADPGKSSRRAISDQPVAETTAEDTKTTAENPSDSSLSVDLVSSTQEAEVGAPITFLTEKEAGKEGCGGPQRPVFQKRFFLSDRPRGQSHVSR